MSSIGQGEARFRRMKRQTQEVRAAEIEYRSVSHRAQDARAISESDQSSNFQDHASDGYGAYTLRLMGYPMGEKRDNRVRDWMDGKTQRMKTPQVAQDAGAAEKEGDWVHRVDSMEFSEDPGARDVDRWKDRIDAWDKERRRLRKQGPFQEVENDFHPQNTTVTGIVERNLEEEATPLAPEKDDGEDMRQSPSNPRMLYNPDALPVNDVDSARQASRWIGEHFNGRWKMRDTGELHGSAHKDR